MRENDKLKMKVLIAEIKDEISNLRPILAENEKVLEKIEQGIEFDSLMTRGQGSIMHDFYTGIERIFEKIAHDINGGIPSDPSWYQRLLYEMSLDVAGVRSAIISSSSYDTLKELLSFRHLFRNIYGFELEKDKIDSLTKLLSDKGPSVLEEIDNKLSELGKTCD